MNLPLLLASLLVSPAETPEEVWKDFDPRKEPLEIEVIRSWTNGAAAYREFYFTGMTSEGEKVRVYSIYATPLTPGRHPAVLHIHGGGQTAYEGWLRYWTDRDYAALTFNWGGEWQNREKYTHWGRLRQGNHLHVGDKLMATEPSVHESSWYLWTRVCMRALTALEVQPEVDPKRLGIFGISMGGTITWPMAAIDRRVKASCAIYGVGWNTYPDSIGEPDASASNPKIALWRKLMEPESYARLIRSPILFLDASNDQHGKMDWAYRTLDATPGFHRWAFTPLYRHHIAEAEGRDLGLWMDTWLKKKPLEWPEPPKLEIVQGARGQPEFRLTPVGKSDFTNAEVYYAIGNANPKNRFWRQYPLRYQPEIGTARGEIPVLDPSLTLYAFANVDDAHGIRLSSRLAMAEPKNWNGIRRTETPDPMVGDFTSGISGSGWITTSTGTDPVPPFHHVLQWAAGPEGRHGLTTTLPISIVTHKIGDPKWQGPAGSRLRITLYAPAVRKLKIILHEKEFAIGWKSYAVSVSLGPEDGWRTISLAPGDFQTDQGERLSQWAQANMLEFSSPGGPGSEPVYEKVRWGAGE